MAFCNVNWILFRSKTKLIYQRLVKYSIVNIIVRIHRRKVRLKRIGRKKKWRRITISELKRRVVWSKNLWYPKYKLRRNKIIKVCLVFRLRMPNFQAFQNLDNVLVVLKWHQCKILTNKNSFQTKLFYNWNKWISRWDRKKLKNKEK